MRLLGFDTTRDFLTLVLIDGENTYREIIKEGNKKHTSLLLPAVDKLLTAHGLSVADIDYFSAVVGPGSFTGIRVGIAAANALAYAQNKKMVEVTSLELIAYNNADGVALIDALHGNYYGGVVKDGKIIDMRYYEAGELTDDTKKLLQDGNDGYADAYAAICREKVGDGVVCDSLFPLYLRESQAEREAKK